MYALSMSVPVTLLGLLERQPSHGYELKRSTTPISAGANPSPSARSTPPCPALCGTSKVEPGEVEPGEGPDRKRYAITETGQGGGGGVAR